MGHKVKYQVLVSLKDEVLDPEAKTIQEVLSKSGFASLKDVHISKRYEIEIDAPESEAEKMAHAIAEGYLANPVSQSFRIQRI